MKLKEITVTAGLKMSKNYQTCESTISVTAEIEKGETSDDVYNELSQVVHGMVNKDIHISLEDLKKYK